MIIPVRSYMVAAIEQAKKAKKRGDYAIGSVVVVNNKIIGYGGNSICSIPDPTNHAEIVALRNASTKINNRYLEGAVLYTTHETCPMCTGAAIMAKIKGIVYGASIEDMKNYSKFNKSEVRSWRVIDLPSRLIAEKGDPFIEIVGPFMREECLELFHTN